jgi:hypothetical protein
MAVMIAPLSARVQAAGLDLRRSEACHVTRGNEALTNSLQSCWAMHAGLIPFRALRAWGASLGDASSLREVPSLCLCASVANHGGKNSNLLKPTKGCSKLLKGSAPPPGGMGSGFSLVLPVKAGRAQSKRVQPSRA